MAHVCLWSTLTALSLHHLPISTVLYVLSNSTLDLLNFCLMMWTSYTRLVNLLFQRLQPLSELFDIPFARSSLQRLPTESAIQRTSRTVRARSGSRLVQRIASYLLPPAFVTSPRDLGPRCFLTG
jgi:hypothetical protein